MVQQNIFYTFIHHKFIMQTHRLENLFFASYSFKDLVCVECVTDTCHKKWVQNLLTVIISATPCNTNLLLSQFAVAVAVAPCSMSNRHPMLPIFVTDRSHSRSVWTSTYILYSHDLKIPLQRWIQFRPGRQQRWRRCDPSGYAATYTYWCPIS